MSKANVIKQDLLRRKINEYFTKNPKSRSVIIKTNIGEVRTMWKVVREKNNYKITEVNTNRKQFVFESGIAVVKEASVEFSGLSNIFVQAMTPPFDHTKLSNALNAANRAIGKMTDPKEKNEAGAMIGALTGMVDSTTQGGGGSVNIQGSSLQTSSKKMTGKVLKEAESSDSTEKKSPKSKKKEEPSSAEKLDSSQKPDDTGGLEANVDSDDSDEQSPIKAPSAEETAISKGLNGQTIKAANIQMKPSGGELTLDLINAAEPAKLEWSNNGKVVFRLNGRPYVINRGQV